MHAFHIFCYVDAVGRIVVRRLVVGANLGDERVYEKQLRQLDAGPLATRTRVVHAVEQRLFVDAVDAALDAVVLVPALFRVLGIARLARQAAGRVGQKRSKLARVDEPEPRSGESTRPADEAVVVASYFWRRR
jgi:hypothetical protein